MSAVIWISHRGLADHAPENTRTAFSNAIAAGYQHLETDLRTSADGHLVLSHDACLTRICANPAVVEDSTRAQLQQVELDGGERLMFFDELLMAFDQYRWILDIKAESARATLTALERQMRDPRVRQWLTEQVRYLFWSRGLQRAWQAAHPQVRCMAREDQCRRAGLAVLAGLAGAGGITSDTTYALPARWHGRTLLRRQLVEVFQRRGARVLAFLPETPAEVELAVAAGVDEILCDQRPGLN